MAAIDPIPAGAVGASLRPPRSLGLGPPLSLPYRLRWPQAAVSQVSHECLISVSQVSQECLASVSGILDLSYEMRQMRHFHGKTRLRQAARGTPSPGSLRLARTGNLPHLQAAGASVNRHSACPNSDTGACPVPRHRAHRSPDGRSGGSVKADSPSKMRLPCRRPRRS